MRIREWIIQYIKAFRLLSLTLALGAVGLGMAAGFLPDADVEYLPEAAFFLRVVLITLAGLASQAGANLINDFFDGDFKYRDPSTRRLRFLGRNRSIFDVLVFLTGIACLGLAGLIGLYLVYLTDWKLLVIGILGISGSYAYTGEPFVYKRRGLGVPLSFLLMGPLMSLGACYALWGVLSWAPVLLSLPVALLIPALMISNEIRDYRRDRRLSEGTLTTRIGARKSLVLYDALLAGSLVLTLLWIPLGLQSLSALAALALIPLALRARRTVAGFRGAGIPWTNTLHLGLLIITLSSVFL